MIQSRLPDDHGAHEETVATMFEREGLGDRSGAELRSALLAVGYDARGEGMDE